MNTKLNRWFWSTLNSHNIDKIHACLAASGGRTESARELTDKEANWFCREGYIIIEKDQREAKDKKRKQLIAMSYSIGEDVEFVKSWCEKYGVGRGDRRILKHFNAYNLQELHALVAKFQKVVDHRIMSVSRQI